MKLNSTVLFIVAAMMVFSIGASPSAFGQESDQKAKKSSDIPDTGKDNNLNAEEIDKDRPASRSADSRAQNRKGSPRDGRGRPEADRRSERNREGESERARDRRQGDRQRGDRSDARNRDGDKSRGDRDARPGDRQRGEKTDDRNQDRSRGERGPRGFGGPAFFRLLDENHDGLLSKRELSNAAERLQELDTNKDGSLDPRELFGGGPQGFRGGSQGFGRSGGSRTGFRPPFERRGDDSPSEARQPERRPDDASQERRRPDGSVQRSRGDSSRSRSGDAQRSRSRGRSSEGATDRGPGNLRFLEELLKRLDKNSDGKISKSESSERLLEGFSRFDSNNDGSLDLEELRRAFSRRGGRDAQQKRPERNREEKKRE
jgi:Ca2+-binding EF-hand superfamily protein